MQIFVSLSTSTQYLSRAIIEVEKPKSGQVNHSWVRILALIPCLVAEAILLSVQLELSIQLSISLSIPL